MISLETARDKINEALSCLSLNKDPLELYEPIKYILSIGGKRIRPCMVIMACSLFRDTFDEAIKPALAIEIFHNFTLLHDDIMDNSPLRRGMSTVHEKWDQNIAILSGDAMVFIAYEQLMRTRKDVIADLIQIFNRMAMEVCEGQQYDMNFESKIDVSEAEYLKMIELKTAVLMGSSLQIGAIIGGADRADAENMYSFGKNLGLAFQLQDDLLDVYGDTEIFGKKTGGDIVAGKKTYLIVKTLELADENMQALTITTLYDVNMDKETKIGSIKSIFNQLGIREVVNEKINEYFLRANEALDKVHVKGDRKDAFYNLAKSLLNREK